jgi:hypothetical protein
MSNQEVYQRASSVNDIRVDITDDELKRLTLYFQKSREELVKVGMLLFDSIHIIKY